MNKDAKTKHIVDVIFVLVLFAVFTASALVLVILGANVYKETVKNMSHCYDTRISTSYITQKVRQNDSYDSVSVGKLLDTDALIFSHTIGEETYSTYIYCHEGYLKELFMRTDTDIGVSPLLAGSNIMKADSFVIESVNDSLLHITITGNDSDPQDVLISLHSTNH